MGKLGSFWVCFFGTTLFDALQGVDWVRFGLALGLLWARGAGLDLCNRLSYRGLDSFWHFLNWVRFA